MGLMDSIKSTTDKLDLLERLSERAEKESLKRLLEEIKTDIQLLDNLLLGLRSISTSVDYSTLYDSSLVSSSGYSATAVVQNWEVKMEALVNAEGLQLLHQKVDARYPLKNDK